MDLYVWGWGKYAQLGHGDDKNALLPKPIDKVTLQGQKVKDLDAGFCYTVVLTSRGDVFTWGYGKYGQLGHQEKRGIPIPRRVRALQGLGIMKVAAGREHTVVITTEGLAYSWGCGAFGILGHGDERESMQPKKIEIFERINLEEQRKEHQIPIDFEDTICKNKLLQKEDIPHCIDVSCGLQHTMLLTTDGIIYSCGFGKFGRLGHGTQESQLRPRLITTLLDRKIVQVKSGWMHSAAITEEGKVYTWGCGRDYQLGAKGLSVSRDMSIPSQLTWFVSKTKKGGFKTVRTPIAQSVSCGGKHNLLLTQDGKVYVWGRGEYGRLGLGDEKHLETPTLLTLFEENNIKIQGVAAGAYHSVALTQDGNVYTWGCGEYGRLGHGDEHHLWKPTQVLALTNKTNHSVFAGAFMSVALNTPSHKKTGVVTNTQLLAIDTKCEIL